MAYQYTQDQTRKLVVDTPDQQSFMDEREFVGAKKHNQSLKKGVWRTIAKDKKATVGSGGCFRMVTSREEEDLDQPPNQKTMLKMMISTRKMKQTRKRSDR